MKIFTYPNIGPFNRNGRGGLRKRQKELKKINKKYGTVDFQLVEIPADLIKNVSEEKRTGLRVCSFVDEKSVKHLYTPGFLDIEVRYVLHTEPVSSKKGLNGSCTPKLEWYDPNWVTKFINHVFCIIDFLKIMPYAIEVHPGKFENGKNSIKVLSQAIEALHTRYEQKYNERILIFIENRPDQYIQDGADIAEFWEYFKNEYPHLTDRTGIILDILQLYTSTKKYGKNFESEFSIIPKESLLGVHIHGKHEGERIVAHQPPLIDDKIPWEYVSEHIKDWGTEKRPLHVLPEVHHAKHVEITYEFCKDYLGL